MPHPPYLLNLYQSDIFVSLKKKVLKGKPFEVEEVKQKVAEALKGIKSTSLKTVLSSGKTILIGVLHQIKSTLKMMEV